MGRPERSAGFTTPGTDELQGIVPVQFETLVA
jgi:hypothetical protein